jgi:hypothetical protein
MLPRGFLLPSARAALAAASLFLAACAAPRPMTSVSAGALAARLANDRCQKAYGQRPFAPEDFEAILQDKRWHWGTAEGGKVDGYEVDVSFDASGRRPRVDVRIPPE